MALSRFGTFSNLQQTTSSSTDVFPNTNTFTFHGASYTSQWLSFEPNEILDRNSQPLESPPANVFQTFQNVDKPPFTTTSEGFPFLDIGGIFTLTQTGFSPQLLQGMSWDQIASALSDPSAASTKAIVGHANTLTAAICITTHDQPASVCSLPVIRGIESQLNGLTPPTP